MGCVQQVQLLAVMGMPGVAAVPVVWMVAVRVSGTSLYCRSMWYWMRGNMGRKACCTQGCQDCKVRTVLLWSKVVLLPSASQTAVFDLHVHLALLVHTSYTCWANLFAQVLGADALQVPPCV